MMVMFATATTASLKKTNDVVIMLKNHERALHVNAGGKVTATDISLAQFFSMESVGDIFSDTFKIALYAKEVGRYLCFRRGKLVGMKNLTRDCHFIESLDHGYFLYANAYNPLWRVGFTKGLKPVGPRHWKRPQTLKRACFLFVKINAEHFDRSRFTTTTTIAPSTRAATAVTLREGHKFHDSKASIIDSNSNNYKTTKSADNGQRQLQTNSENVNATGGRKRQWPDRDVRRQRQRHRKRKHHAKLSATNINNGSSLLQPKNLIRHHHDQGNGEGRRRQHQREERERKLRLKNQRRQQQEQQHDPLESEPMPNATNSASPTQAATTLAATASLAPSALNIVAMLAAGRRKRGRRKKSTDTSVTNLSSNSGQHQAMDLQLVAQSPLQAQSQYDRVQTGNTKSHDHKLRHHHEHNYHQKHQPTIAPVSSISLPTPEVIKVQQQNHKYSNINTNSQLYKRSRSRRNISNNNSISISISNSNSSSINHNSSSSINRTNLSHNYTLNLNHNVNNINLNNNNNNYTINAIPALPKKYLSKNNFNHEYARSSTDFNTKQNSSHSPHSTHVPKAGHSNTSHDLFPLQQKVTTDNVRDSGSGSGSDRDSDRDNDNVASSMHEKNSNRLLVNSINLRDNNLQQEHLVKRFKLIYLYRIRSHSNNFNLQLKTNTNNKINIQQQQHYNNYNDHVDNNSPISSTTIKLKTKTTNDFSSSNEFEAKNWNDSSSSSSSIKNSSISRSNLKAFTTSHYNHSHRRTKRNVNNDYITNNNNSNNTNNKNNDIYDKDDSKDNTVNNNNKNYAKINSHAGRSSSSSRLGSLGRNNKISNKFQIQNRYTFANVKQEYSKFLMPSTAANRNSKLLTILSRQQQQQQQPQQQQQIIKLIKNPNNNNYNNYNDNDYEKQDDEEFKRIQNKYRKTIVQYRSVFNCLENEFRNE